VIAARLHNISPFKSGVFSLLTEVIKPLQKTTHCNKSVKGSKLTNILNELGAEVFFSSLSRLHQEVKRKIRSMQMCPAFKNNSKNILFSLLFVCIKNMY